MKLYWCVKSKFYSDGTVKAAITFRLRKEPPKDTFRSVLPRRGDRVDIYTDFRPTLHGAKNFLGMMTARCGSLLSYRQNRLLDFIHMQGGRALDTRIRGTGRVFVY